MTVFHLKGLRDVTLQKSAAEDTEEIDRTLVLSLDPALYVCVAFNVVVLPSRVSSSYRIVIVSLHPYK